MFNLVNDPWIPVFCKGKSKLVSLRGAFEELPKIASVEGASIEKISLIRLLICIAQAALKGPKNDKAWEDCKQDVVPSALKYLDKWEKKFDLHGKNSFLQMPWLPELKNKRVESLRILYPSGNNHALFNHDALRERVDLTDSELALALLVTQEFGVGGLVQNPAFKWLNKKVPALTSAQATSINNILLTVIMGDNLLDTVHNNMIPTEWLNSAKTQLGRPVWEYGTFEKDGPEYHEIQCSYLGNLVPLTRGIVLYPGEVNITLVEGVPAIDYPAYREPMAALKSEKIGKPDKKKASKKTSPYLPCSIHKSGWRELESILRLPGGAGIPHTGVMAFKHFAKQMDTHPELTIMVAGFASYQAKKEGVLEWSFVLPAGFMSMDSMINYKKFVEDAEECSKQLSQALYRCINAERKSDKPGDKDNVLAMMRSTASSEFWPKMEALAMRILEANAKNTGWKSEILKEARAIYNRVCPDISMNSRVKGLQLLN
jgi:CRISPR system Cascade subunit CasA